MNLSLKKYFESELLNSISIAMCFRIIGIFSSYLLVFIIARFYNSEALGYFSIIQTYLMIASIFCKLGLDTASLRLVSKHNAQKKFSQLKNDYFIITKIILINSIFFGVILFLLADIISNNIFHKPEMTKVLKMVPLILFPFSMLYIHSQSFRGFKNITYFSIFNNVIISFFASLILIIVHKIFENSLFDPVLSYFFATIILSIISFKVWFNKLENISSDENDKTTTDLKKIFNLSIPMLLSSSMSYILNWSSILILGIYLSAHDVGVYNLAAKISMVTSIGLFSINSISAPKISEYFTNNDMMNFNKIIFQTSRMIFWFSLPLLILLIVFSDFFLSIFGDEFIEAKIILIILCVGQFVNSISGSVGYILQMTGKHYVFQNIMIFATFLNIVLNFILIPKYGILGAAISQCLTIILWNILSVLYVRKYYNILTLYIPFYTKKMKI